LQKKPEPAPRGERADSGEWQKPEMLRLNSDRAEFTEGQRGDGNYYS
jgi:hypothetical protein